MLARHRGGGGGGRHGGHGHHHHHGGGWRWRGDGGGGYWPGGYQNYVVPFTCPAVYAPVIGTDGRMYDNACYANASGVAVAQRLPEGSQRLTGALGEMTPGTRTALAVGGFSLAALGLWLIARREESPQRSGHGNWYAVGYNYPPGHRDRRVKWIERYGSKRAAQKATRSADMRPFYTRVTKRTVDYNER